MSINRFPYQDDILRQLGGGSASVSEIATAIAGEGRTRPKDTTPTSCTGRWPRTSTTSCILAWPSTAARAPTARRR